MSSLSMLAGSKRSREIQAGLSRRAEVSSRRVAL